MSATGSNSYCHSADVRMHLSVNGSFLPIGQLGPDFLILDQPTDHGPTNGEITICIDGHERRWKVRLPDGIAPGQGRTRVEAR